MILGLTVLLSGHRLSAVDLQITIVVVNARNGKLLRHRYVRVFVFDQKLPKFQETLRTNDQGSGIYHIPPASNL